MRRVVAFAAILLCAACGTPAPAAVQLPPTASASAAPIATVSQHATANACAVWSECRRIGEPVRVSETKIGQSPDVAWDGTEALVAYETPSEGSHLVAVDAAGRILWTELVAGMTPHIAWNPRSRSGLLVTNQTIAWLGRDGKPAHRTNAPRTTNVGFHYAVAAMGEGFIVASGVGSHASNAPPVAFSIATIGAPSDTIDWKRMDDDGLRHAPAIATPDAATWIVSQPFKTAAQLFSIRDIGARPLVLPGASTLRAVAIGEERKEPFVVLADDTTHALSVTSVRSGSPTPPADLGVRSTRSGSAVVLHVGGRLVIGADKIGDSPGVALAPLDLAPTPSVGAPLAIGPEASQHLHAVANDRGFVATWNIADEAAPMVTLVSHAPIHGLSAMLAIYACCPSAVK